MVVGYIHRLAIKVAAESALRLLPVGAAVRALDSSQWWSQERLHQLQQQKLAALISHAFQRVPYYRRTLEEAGYCEGEAFRVEDLARLPILDKDMLRSSLQDMLDPQIRVTVNYSGGSTGTPIAFYQDHNYWLWNRADKIRTYRMAGYKFGAPCLVVWGADQDSRQHRGLRRLVVDQFLLNLNWVNAFKQTSQDVRRVLRTISKVKPEFVVGYASSLHLLAQSMLANGAQPSTEGPRGIQSSAEVLTPAMRQTIQEAFGAPVFDRYGGRELGNVAQECDAHEGLHVLEESNLVEVVDANGQASGPGLLGRIIVTNLNNHGMPFVRYDTGDIGAWLEGNCPCGRGMKRLQGIVGRSSSLITTPTGVVIHGEFFTHLFYGLGTIKQFQVVQETPEAVIVTIVPGEGFNIACEETLRKAILRQGISSVAFEHREFLPPLPSGKYQFVYSKVPPPFSPTTK